MGLAGPGLAAGPVPDPADPTKPVTPTDPAHPGATISPGLALVDVRSPAITAANSALDSAKRATGAAQTHKVDLERSLVDLTGQQDQARQRVAASITAVADAQARVLSAQQAVADAQAVVVEAKAVVAVAKVAVTKAQAAIKSVAIATYVDGEAAPNPVDLLGDQGNALDTYKRHSLAEAALAARFEQLRQRQAELAAATTRQGDAESAQARAEQAERDRQQEQRDRAQDQRAAEQHLVDVTQKIASTTDQIRQAANDITAALVHQQGATLAVADVRVLAPVMGADFPLVVLDAYWRAAHRAPCKVEWWALAGIGYVESKHGTDGGSRVDATGRENKPIIGIPLDGANGTALVRDSDGGAMDGDSVFDRAVGPMQFIPSTFKAFEVDGDGDGKADPEDYYDAAATTAKYMCFGRPDLTTDAGLRSAYLSYNQSDIYASMVLAQAHGYQASVVIPPVPPPLPAG